MNKDRILRILQDAVKSRKLLETSCGNIVALLNTPELPEWVLGSLEALIIDGNWKELNNRFFKSIEFGTAGMRGRTIGEVSTKFEKEGDEYVHAAIGSTCMNDLNVVIATIGLFNHCKFYQDTDCEFPKRPSLVIAHDMRYFSRHFCELTATVWSKLGGDVYIFEGPRSTPQLSFSVRYLKACAGVMITASHNPYFDNGYKVYFDDGAQINETHAHKIMQEIQKLSYSDVLKYLEIDLREVHTLTPFLDSVYLECCQEALLDVALFKTMKQTKIIYTPLHGTGSVCILPLMKNYEWNICPVESQLEMDSAFPTVKSPNPDNLETLKLALEKAKAEDADGIIATDPDGDRMSAMLKDRKGNWCLLNGNTIAILLAEYRLNAMEKLELLPKDNSNMAVIKSFVTTPLLKSFAEKNGLKCIETHTGFKWIGEKLKDYEAIALERLSRLRGISLDYTRCSYKARRNIMLKDSTFFFLGAEESCGFLANDAVRDKDANAATMMFCEFIAYLRAHELSFTEYLDEIYAKYGYFKEDLLSFTFDGAEGFSQIKHLMASYRNNMPKRMGESRVMSVTDFSKPGDRTDADGKAIPPSNFMLVHLLNGCSIAIRPSGTEPKLKMYLFGQAEVGNGDDLPSIKKEVGERLETLKAWLKQDVASRSA